MDHILLLIHLKKKKMSAASGGKINTVLSYILNITDAHRGRTKTLNTNDKLSTLLSIHRRIQD